jgi:hypothetical protein
MTPSTTDRDTTLALALQGDWGLVSWTIEYPGSGRSTQPFGADAEGLLMYSANGHMAAVLQQRNRPALSRANVALVPDSEKAAAFASYLQYAGTWTVQDGNVLHTVQFAMNPNLTGTVQVRTMAFEGDRLVLGADEPLESGGVSRRHRIVWARIKAR